MHAPELGEWPRDRRNSGVHPRPRPPWMHHLYSRGQSTGAGHCRLRAARGESRRPMLRMRSAGRGRPAHRQTVHEPVGPRRVQAVTGITEAGQAHMAELAEVQRRRVAEAKAERLQEDLERLAVGQMVWERQPDDGQHAPRGGLVVEYHDSPRNGADPYLVVVDVTHDGAAGPGPAGRPTGFCCPSPKSDRSSCYPFILGSGTPGNCSPSSAPAPVCGRRRTPTC